MSKNTINHINYLTIGHITIDIQKSGNSIGGTAAYSSKCALALGKFPAMLTSGNEEIIPQKFEDIQIIWKKSKNNTTFENIETPNGRKQILHAIAEPLLSIDVPKKLRDCSLVHLGPVANEVDPNIINIFPNSFIGLTPQGWMRSRDRDNIVKYHFWEHAEVLLNRANAVVLSIEDIKEDEGIIQSYANQTRVLVVTEGANGARVYWNGDGRHFSAPKVHVNDMTGAGDIFATAFFDKLERSKNPWESAKLAIQIASNSVARKGLAGVPTNKEIRSFQTEIIEGK
jgi:hypothetical protein